MLAKRKYLEIEAAAEAKVKENEHYFPSAQEQLEEDDEMISILSDVVFKGQFTVEQLYNGASGEYIYGKLREAVFGKPKTEGNEGNEKGE